MTTVFDAVSAALASLLGTDTVSAGYILGFVTIVVLVVILTWVLGDSLSGIGIVIPAGIAAIFVALVGWWPLWTIIFTGLFLGLVLMNPFEGGASSG